VDAAAVEAAKKEGHMTAAERNAWRAAAEGCAEDCAKAEAALREMSCECGEEVTLGLSDHPAEIICSRCKVLGLEYDEPVALADVSGEATPDRARQKWLESLGDPGQMYQGEQSGE
jgi:hypothetical protein